jgi:phosphatidate cytidylyltransferase
VGANLKARAITALIAIPLLVLLIAWAPSWLFAAFLFLLMIAALCEYLAMVFPRCFAEQVFGIVLGAVIFLSLVLPEVSDPEIGLGVSLVVCFCGYLFIGGKLNEKLMRLAWTLLGCFYLGFLLPHWVLLFRLPQGREWVFFILLVIMAGDSAAYFVGRRFGKRKLAPEISPGKTVEGAVGYVAGSIVAGGIGGMFLLPESHEFEVIAVALCLSILGQLGDLFESWIKRAFTVKDSGSVLPGHGGLLDRLDSLIFPAVFTTAYLKVFHS